MVVIRSGQVSLLARLAWPLIGLALAIFLGAVLLGLDIIIIPERTLAAMPAGASDALRSFDHAAESILANLPELRGRATANRLPSAPTSTARQSATAVIQSSSPVSGRDVTGVDLSSEQSPPDRPLPSFRPTEVDESSTASAYFALNGSGDDDRDGLSNAFEQWAADAFFPHLFFDEKEPANVGRDLLRLYQVSPARDSSGLYYAGPDGVLLTFVVAYKRDYGIKAEMPDIRFPVWGGSIPMRDYDFFIAGHPGDTEALRILITNPPGETERWVPIAVMIKRHYDPWHVYYPGEFKWSGSHIKLQVSGGKHAMYLTKSQCESYHINFEVCSGGASLTTPIETGRDGFNVGEHLGQLFETIPRNDLGLFENEQVWTNRRFCGGASTSNRDHCAGDLYGKWWPPADLGERRKQGAELASYATRQFLTWYPAYYEVTFFTGDREWAGTDLDVDLTLFGDRSFTQTDLDTPNHDDFERGQADAFAVGVADLGYLTHLKVRAYYPHASGVHSNSEWFLESILVQSAGGVCYEFDCNCWLDWDVGFDETIGENTRSEVRIIQSNAYHCIDF